MVKIAWLYPIALKLFLVVACFVLFMVFALTEFKPFVNATRIEETFAPLVSTSLVLATLAFLAVFNVLIRDFFWMDMGGSWLSKFLSFLQTKFLSQYARQSVARLAMARLNEKSITYGEEQP